MGKNTSLIIRAISRLKNECPSCRVPLEVKTELVETYKDPEVDGGLQYEHWVEVYRKTIFCNTCGYSRTKIYKEKHHKEREGYDPGIEDDRGPNSFERMRSQGLPM